MTMPPVAKRIDHELKIGNNKHIDPYYWIRDDERKREDVLSLLKEENDYTEKMMIMSGCKKGQEILYQELVARVDSQSAGSSSTTSSIIQVPYICGPYFYYQRHLKGDDYPIYCRMLRADVGNAAEEVLLNVNELIKGDVKFAKIGQFKPSENHKLIAYTVDTVGYGDYQLVIVEADKDVKLVKVVDKVCREFEWASLDEEVFYMTSDHAHRPHKLWSTRLTSTKKDDDKCLFTEDNESLELDLVKSSSKKFLFVQSCGRDSTRNLAVPLTSLDNSEKKLQLVQPMKENVLYSTYHVSSTCGEDGDNSKNDYDEFWLVTNEDGATNSKIVSMKIKNNDMSSKCGDNSLVFHDPKVKIDHLVCFSTHVVVFCRKNGFSTFFTISLAASAGREVKEVQWSDQVYSVKNVETNSENWDGDFIRVVYSTLSSPPVTLDYFFSTGEKKICSKELKKPGGSLNLDEKMEEKKKDEKMEKKESLYETKRLCVDVCDKDDNDGKDPSSRRSQRSQRSVPMSMVYRKDLFKSDGKNKCILYGYGSYGLSVEPEYDSNRLSLLDRGIVFIIAHIRGGGEMGKDWHHEGRMLKKKNTFTDFIACAEELIKLGITSPENLAISGGSAGGLLMAVVLNMRPELFRTCLCRVPYVDAIVTMADPSIPLVVPEWKEFGNTNEQDVYDYVIQYSPIENVASAFKKAEPKLKQIALEKVEVNDELKDGFGSAFHFDRKVGKYPSMLVTTSLQDSMVAYWEPTKWVSTLRHNIPYYSAGRDDASHDDKKEEKNNNSGGRNGSMLLLKTKMQNAGHGGSSGKYSALADKATEFSFLLTELDVSI